jgi:hypothetical protein
MVDVEQIKVTLSIPSSDTSQDALIQREINRAKGHIQKYVGMNVVLDFDNDYFLDDCIDYMVCRRLNLDTRNSASAGKSGENVGASFTFINDLPNDLKDVLNTYRKVGFF